MRHQQPTSLTGDTGRPDEGTGDQYEDLLGADTRCERRVNVGGSETSTQVAAASKHHGNA